MKTYIRIGLLLAFLPGIFISPAKACTNFLVTKGATVDGSTMIFYAADSHIRYGELYFSPATNWPEGSMVTVYDRGTAEQLGEIPQVPYTYQTVGFMNEHQLAIGESTFGGRSELVDTTGLMDYAALMFLATQRAKTARETIKVIAELIEKHGYASTGGSFSIDDPDEVWIMELIGKGTDLQYDDKKEKYINTRKGAVWVAIRIPDGYVSAHANHARITRFPKENEKRSISSKNLDKIFYPDVRKVQSELENKFTEYTPGVDAAALNLWKTDQQLAREFLTDYSCNMGNYTVKRWKELGEFLLVKYLDGNRKQEKEGKFLRNPWGYPQPPSFPGYPDEWKEKVIKNTGDRFVYPESDK